MSRLRVTVISLIGLIGAIALTAGCLFIMQSGVVPILVTNTLLIFIVFAFFGVISVAEIPLMIFGMRQMEVSVNPKAQYALFLTIMGYSFFAGFYAACFVLLTGHFWAGIALASLGFVRFLTTIMFIGKRNSLNEPKSTNLSSG